MTTCAGVQSPINPHLPTRLCQSCELYQFAADGIKPAARRAGPHFRCVNYVAKVSSCAGESQLSAGSGTETGPAIFCDEE